MMKRRWPAVMLAVVLLLSSQMVSAVADGLDKTCVDGGGVAFGIFYGVPDSGHSKLRVRMGG